MKYILIVLLMVCCNQETKYFPPEESQERDYSNFFKCYECFTDKDYLIKGRSVTLSNFKGFLVWDDNKKPYKIKVEDGKLIAVEHKMIKCGEDCK